VVRSATSLEELEVGPKTKHEVNLVVAINLGIQPGSVGALDDGVVEIIWVTLVLILQLVEEVEDVESESCRRTINRCWKPTGTDELDVFGSGAIATTVTDDEAVNARQVEYHEVVGRGGNGTRVAITVSELDDQSNRCKGRIFEESAIPFLDTVERGIRVA